MPLPAFPPVLARLVANLPVYPASLGFAFACQVAAWPALRGLDWSPVVGRRFCVRVRDLGLSLHFSIRAGGFRAERQGRPEVIFTATAQDFARLALRLEDPDTLFFNRQLVIEGDTDLGLTVKNLLDGLDWDELVQRMPAGLGRLARLVRTRALAGQGLVHG